ncbi:MAG: serine dehydratase subunit alpha family protein [Bacteroidales bacterium]|jgi:L-cysteine desulfidase|nr:serine dehydratase subunit alpha family protein [Bacteroidales bacterium]
MKNKIIALLKQEVKPALGCTEPIAVALAVARSCELLRNISVKPELINVKVSNNILKNGMGVGIPGTDTVGLHIAAALGCTCGKSKYRLEVLKDVTDESVSKAREMVSKRKVTISLAETSEKLYVYAEVCSSKKQGSHKAITIISGNHDSIVHEELDGKIIKSIENSNSEDPTGNGLEPDFARKITIEQILDFATSTPLEELEFIMESVTLNKALVDDGLRNKYGLQVGRTLLAPINKDVYGDTYLTYAMAYTAAASDARMAGSTLPAMSNSGSGNQGITATVPVIAIAEKLKSNHEDLARALVISHLVAIHIKGHLGRLSALCGCVVASTGSACGIVYLRKGGYEQMCAAIKNMIGNITGMVCDGAKVGCALKVASGVASALQSAVLALDGICISSNDGIIEEDIEKTIANLGKIGSIGMQSTDEMILEIMVCK